MDIKSLHCEMKMISHDAIVVNIQRQWRQLLANQITGEPPFLAARGEAVLTLRPAAGRQYRLHAVDTAGKRLAEIPLTPGGDGSLGCRIAVFNPFGAVFAYELEAVR